MIKPNACPQCGEDRKKEDMRSKGGSVRCVHCIAKEKKPKAISLKSARFMLICQQLSDIGVEEDLMDESTQEYRLNWIQKREDERARYAKDDAVDALKRRYK